MFLTIAIPLAVELDLETLQRASNNVLDTRQPFYSSRAASSWSRTHHFIRQCFVVYEREGLPRLLQRIAPLAQSPVTMAMLDALLMPLSLGSGIISTERLRALLNGIWPYVQRLLTGLMPPQVKLVDKRVLDSILSTLERVSRAVAEPEYQHQCKILRLEVANVLFRSPFLEKRILGLTDIKVKRCAPATHEAHLF